LGGPFSEDGHPGGRVELREKGTPKRAMGREGKMNPQVGDCLKNSISGSRGPDHSRKEIEKGGGLAHE